MKLSVFSRKFATATSAPIVPPIRLYSLEGRYATALYTAAIKTNCLTESINAMEKIRGAIEKSTAIRQMIGNPTIQKGEKMRMVNDLLARQNYPQVIGNFFASLVENGRLDQTVKIMGCFEELVRAHKGIVEVRITTAKELSNEVNERIKSTIQKKFIKPNQTVKITQTIDPALLGGFKIEVGEKTVDLSVATKVNLLNKSLKEGLQQ